MIEASIICDSISPQCKRLTTFRLRYPKWIHGEFLTHRVISRNASSSRAVPTKKLLEEVRSDALRAGPVFWGKNQSGMQAAEELDDTENNHYVTPKTRAKQLWQQAARDAADRAEMMLDLGVHKQIVNRLLEPFSHINVVATATEWGNFFGLRLHKDAQPEMRALAIAMWEARKASTPNQLETGGWHLPFITEDDWAQYPADLIEGGDGYSYEQALDACIKVSVARCARVSYESFESPGRKSWHSDDLKLYDRLLGAQPLHASPAEHQATPDSEAHFMTFPRQGETLVSNRSDEWGNFKGWIQYRQLLPNEAVAPIPEEFR